MCNHFPEHRTWITDFTVPNPPIQRRPTALPQTTGEQTDAAFLGSGQTLCRMSLVRSLALVVDPQIPIKEGSSCAPQVRRRRCRGGALKGTRSPVPGCTCKQGAEGNKRNL